MEQPSRQSLVALQKKIWDGSIPVAFYLNFTECTVYNRADPYIVQVPRIGYLPSLLPKLLAFFQNKLIEPDVKPHNGWFSIDGSALPWHYPVGLLYDIYSSTLSPDIKDFLIKSQKPNKTQDKRDDAEVEPTRSQTPEHQFSQPLPWRITVHFHSYPTNCLVPLGEELEATLDAFQNSLKEASFLRHQTAKVQLALPPKTMEKFWSAINTQDVTAFNVINSTILDPSSTFLRCIPLRLFVPMTTAVEAEEQSSTIEQREKQQVETNTKPGRPFVFLFPFRIIQSPIASRVLPPSSNDVLSYRPDEPYPPDLPIPTLGIALNQIAPELFPSTEQVEDVVPVLHGAVISMSAPLDTLGRYCAFPDGWLNITLAPRMR